MDQQALQWRLADFEQKCRQHGIPCTAQRRVILAVVLQRNDHPTADQVFQAVARRQLGISRATVHRTVEILVRMGVITKASHSGKAARYDGRSEVHHHLVCLHCDKIIDIHDEQLDALSVPDTSAFNFDVIDHRVQLRGVCADCRGKKIKSD